MNKITQEKVALAMLSAIEAEDIMLKDVAEHLGLTTSIYLSMIKRDTYFNKVSAKAWEAMRTWMYSGKSLRDYRAGEATYEEEEKKAAADLTARIQTPTFTNKDHAEAVPEEAVAKPEERSMGEIVYDLKPDIKALKKEIESQPIVKVSSREVGPSQEIVKRFTIEIEVKCNIK